MRQARLVLALALIAVVAAGCARRSAQTYVMVDPNTGQQYQVVQPQAQMQPQVQTQTTTQYQAPAQYQSRGFELYGQGGYSAQAQAQTQVQTQTQMQGSAQQTPDPAAEIPN